MEKNVWFSGFLAEKNTLHLTSYKKHVRRVSKKRVLRQGF